MIDWIDAIVTVKHDTEKLCGGFVASATADGEIEWTVNKFINVVGSHDASIRIKSLSENRVYVSGNPTKFLQGHNVFGSDDIKALVYCMLYRLSFDTDIGLYPTLQQLKDLKNGRGIALKRVDINYSWHLKNKDEVLYWLRSASNSAYLKNRGKGQFAGDTLYFGKNSRRWSIKCYSKGDEITAKNHQIHTDLCTDELIDWANKSLRIELVIRSLELKRRGLDNLENWTTETAKVLHSEMVLGNLQLSDNVMVSDSILESMNPTQKKHYLLWLAGNDLRVLLSKASFYRVRKEILTFGVDIAIVQQDRQKNVVPLIRYLEAKPAQIPVWAYEKGLVVY